MKKFKEGKLFKLKIAAIVFALIFISISPITSSTYVNNFLNTKDQREKHFDEKTVNFQVSYGEFQSLNIEIDGEIFNKIFMDNSGLTADYGKAELPVYSYDIAVPQGADYVLNYEVSDPSIFTGYNIYPAQLPKPETGGFIDPSFVKDEDFYSKNEFYPESVVEVTSDAIMRGCRIIRVSVYPIVYNPHTNILKKYEEVYVNVEFVGGTNEFIPERLRSIYFQQIFDAFIINSQHIERAQLNNPTYMIRGERADLLIVVYDDFYEEILPLAEWRHVSGIETKVVKWSEIGDNSEDLCEYVQDAYYNWELPPSFLLIVGDADHVPVNYKYNHPYHYEKTGTDHWYVTFEGDDYLPELHTGRISVEDEDELNIVVEKILDYSKTPFMDVNWFDDVLLAACEEYGRFFVETSERIYDFLDPKGYVCNRQFQGGSPPGSTQGVIEAIDNGVIIANHRDHGASQNDGYAYTGWSSPQFTTDTILNEIDNGRMYPIMYSLNCDSGWFDGETDLNSGNYESIGEIGIRVENKGFVAVIAATRVSYSGYNDELCVGFYDAMWSDFDPNYPSEESANPYETEVFKISQIMNYGKFWMYDKYIVPGGCDPYPWNPTEANSRAEFEMFHVHGDPTMDVWTWKPEDLNVSYELGYNSLTVFVESDKQPVQGALVCLCEEDGVYIKGITDESGQLILEVEEKPDNEISLTVTCHNYLYYQETFNWNKPPEKPEKPVGNEKPNLGQTCEYTTYTIDPDDIEVFYNFDWGDGNQSGWLGPFPNGEIATANYSWVERGFYDVKVCAKDIKDSESQWSENLQVLVGNSIPSSPKISGKWLFVKPEVSYDYSFTIIDPDNDDVWLKIRWGKEEPTDWIGPIISGETHIENHTWGIPDSELILAAKSKDIFDEESDWNTITIYTPRTHLKIVNIFERLIFNLPILNLIFKNFFH